MKTIPFIGIALSSLVLSCNQGTPAETPATETQPLDEAQTEDVINFKNKGHELIYDMVQVVGDYDAWHRKKDVVYTYTSQTPDGQTDISTEKYIFDGELSYGAYERHDRSFPDMEGLIEQGYDGKEFWLKHKGEHSNDEEKLKSVAFRRPTNFYWFAMLPKLLDPEVNYEHLGDTTINSVDYSVVKTSFVSETPTDIYQLYINKETSLVDQFLFTVADYGVMDTPFLMKLNYQDVDGLLIPAQRRYKKSTWNAAEDDSDWIKANWSNIKFDNGLSVEDFEG